MFGINKSSVLSCWEIVNLMWLVVIWNDNRSASMSPKPPAAQSRQKEDIKLNRRTESGGSPNHSQQVTIFRCSHYITLCKSLWHSHHIPLYKFPFSHVGSTPASMTPARMFGSVGRISSTMRSRLWGRIVRPKPSFQADYGWICWWQTSFCKPFCWDSFFDGGIGLAIFGGCSICGHPGRRMGMSCHGRSNWNWLEVCIQSGHRPKTVPWHAENRRRMYHEWLMFMFFVTMLQWTLQD